MILFAWLNAFQNDMTWPSSNKNHGGDRFQGKGLDTGQGVPHRDWADVLPTQTFLNSNLVPLKNFIQFHPSVQKLFMIFFNTDAQMDGHTNSIQNESPHYPIWVRAEIFLYSISSTSCALTQFCSDKRQHYKKCFLYLGRQWNLYEFKFLSKYNIFGRLS